MASLTRTRISTSTSSSPPWTSSRTSSCRAASTPPGSGADRRFFFFKDDFVRSGTPPNKKGRDGDRHAVPWQYYFRSEALRSDLAQVDAVLAPAQYQHSNRVE